MARLALRLITPGNPEGAPLAVGEGGGWIGRAPDSEVAIEDPARIVSSRHARIDFDGQGFGLTDQSMNGTDINGKRMTRAERVPLHGGDEIRIGPFRVQVTGIGASLVPGGAAKPGLVAPGSGAADDGRFTMSLDDLIGDAGPAARSGRAMPSFGDSAGPASGPTSGPSFADTATTRAPARVVSPTFEPPNDLPPLRAEPPDGPMPEFAAPKFAVPEFAVPELPVSPQRELPVSPQQELPGAGAVAWVSDADRATSDPAVLLAAFWRGLGIGAPNRPTPAVMEEIGLALHEALVGVAAIPGADGRENPLANGVRDIRGQLNAATPRLAEHVRAAFAAGQARVAATQAAVARAAGGLADSLSARAIERRLEQSVRPRMPLLRRAELWRQFKALEGDVRDAALHRFEEDLAERLSGGAGRDGGVVLPKLDGGKRPGGGS